MTKSIEITVTVAELIDLASCGHRMLSYIKPDDSRLLTVLQSSDGVPVRLMLDKGHEKRLCFNSS
jgi:hypothetical protein